MFQDKAESVHGRGAEVLRGESNLDVCVLVDVLDESADTVEAASHAALEALDGGVGTGTWLVHLLWDILEHDADEPHDGNDEGTESEGSEVVSEHPSHSWPDWSVASLGVGVVGEVPGTGGYDDDELSCGDEESHDPQESEEIEVYHFSGGLVPYHVSSLWSFSNWLEFSDGGDANQSPNPSKEEADVDEVEHDGYHDDAGVLSDEVRGSLKDSNWDLERLQHADEGT